MIRRSRALTIWVFALAFAMRALIPAGYMPSASGQLITLCTGQGVQSAWVDENGKIQKSTHGKSQTNTGDCAFATLAIPALAASQLADVGTPRIAFEPDRPLVSHAIPGHGLAAPPPFQTGPPLLG